ncbi:putative glycosidase CRH2 [Coemansia sp. RSA 2675]|nr:putative glycosidase CRH2 [Coemansia sp. RSA 2675]
MKLSVFGAAAVLAAASSQVLAQSTCNQWAPCSREGYCDSNAMFCLWGLCDPVKSFNSTSCWQPEACATQTVNFDSAADAIPIKAYSGNPSTNAFLSVFEPNHASVANGNLEMKMTYDAAQKKGFGATATASHTFQYGRVTARVKTASVAPGVVSAFIIRNDQTGDEIDFEWVGKDPSEVQTNYYFNNVLDYTKMVRYNVGGNTAAEYHDYTMDWSAEALVWLVDGKVIRTLNRKDTFNPATNTYAYPTSKSRISFSIWDGGNSGAEGTQQWAGFPTPWGPNTAYQMFVDSVQISCGGDSTHPPTSPSVSPPVTLPSSVYPTSVYPTSLPSSSVTPPKKCIPRPHY